MFGIGFTETLLILAVVLIIFGPEKLPELAKSLGQFFGKAKYERDKIKREIYNTMHPPANFTHLDNLVEDERPTSCEDTIDDEIKDKEKKELKEKTSDN